MNKRKITEACKVLNPALCSQGRKGLKLLLEGLGVDFDKELSTGDTHLLSPETIALDGAIEIYKDDDDDLALFFRDIYGQLYVTVGDYCELLGFYSDAKGELDAIFDSSLQSAHAVEVVIYEDALGDGLEWEYFTTEYVQRLEYICNIAY